MSKRFPKLKPLEHMNSNFSMQAPPNSIIRFIILTVLHNLYIYTTFLFAFPFIMLAHTMNEDNGKLLLASPTSPTSFHLHGSGPQTWIPGTSADFDETVQTTGNSEDAEKKNTEVKVKKPKPAWDQFRRPKVKKKLASETSGGLVFPIKILKAVSYLVTAAIVLGSSCVSNVTLFLMTSQVLNNRTMDLCVHEANKRFVVHTPDVERTGWLFALWLSLAAPEVILFFASSWMCIFKKYIQPSLGCFFIFFVTETLQACGLSMLMFSVFSRITAVRALMLTNTLGVLPALLLPLSRRGTGWTSKLKIFFDILSAAGIVICLVIWTVNVNSSDNFFHRYVEAPLAVLLTSMGWWENFINPTTTIPVLNTLAHCREEMKQYNRRHFSRLILSPWKILVFFSILCIYMELDLGDAGGLLADLGKGFQQLDVSIIPKWQTSESAIEGGRGQYLYSGGYLALYVALVQIASSQMCHLASLFAFWTKIHPFSFSFPISVSAPVTLLVLTGLCSFRMESECYLDSLFPAYVFWTCPTGDFVYTFLRESYGWAWILVLAAQTWITSYIWNQIVWTGENQEGFFIESFYVGPALCQSLLFNKRKQYQGQLLQEEQAIGNKSKKETVGVSTKDLNYKPKIYGCATMWHETKEEMVTIVKSIMWLDKSLDKNKNSDNPSKNYIFELHVFFDDAFKKAKKESKTIEVKIPTGKKTVVINEPTKYDINAYVKDLVEVIKKSAKEVYLDKIEPVVPDRYVTPYGGRLVWTLPGNTVITAHLKDSEIVRHKKRWSQVMYLYYLLGYMLLDRHQMADKEYMAFKQRNTFILALDGDIDFKPEAISKLLDIMLKDYDLGAACGRIHPTGSGPIVWYQKFEYAIGHWLQKATEHVLGCVLCSPGCFSLFRAQALVKVAKQYSSIAEEPLHRLQYDQGEDRWLCTLILKEGHRIEYSAASDAFTHAPDTFGDFYIQRKRWGPSTMANIFDLIMDYKVTVEKNNYISRPYILYQLIMMVGSLVGPGTIFLMVVGALIAAFQVSSWIAFSMNAVPVIMFSIICFTLKSQYQLNFAMFLSALYALLMLAVFVGTCLQLKEEGIASPSGIFMIAMAASFVLAGILHPQEFFCLVPGLLYFLLVPSMYLLLTVYSLINMYDISWGTREDPDKKAEEAAQKKEEELMKKKKNMFDDVTAWLGLGDKTSAFSKLNCCSFCGMEKKTSAEEVHLLEKNYETMEEISNRISSFESNTQVIVEALSKQTGIDKVSMIKADVHVNPNCTCGANTPEKPAEASTSQVQKPSTAPKEEKDKKSWIKDECISKGQELQLDDNEIEFWLRMIKKYLKPLYKDAEQEKKGTMGLKMLRNKVVFVFLMMNSFFILVVFLLQINKDNLFIEWPFNYKSNITYIPETNTVLISKEKLQLDPVGMAFAIVFGLLLVLQMIGMVIHRFSTFTLIMADTSLSCNSEDDGMVSAPSSDDSETEDLDETDKRKKSMMKRRASQHFLQIQNTPKVRYRTLEEKRRASGISPFQNKGLFRTSSNRSITVPSPLTRRRNDSDISHRGSDKSNRNSGIDNNAFREQDEDGISTTQ